MTEELIRPDPWYVRLEIANAFEGLATELRAHAGSFADGITVEAVADAVDARASKMRRELQREADRESRATEDREKPFRTAAWS